MIYLLVPMEPEEPLDVPVLLPLDPGCILLEPGLGVLLDPVPVLPVEPLPMLPLEPLDPVPMPLPVLPLPIDEPLFMLPLEPPLEVDESLEPLGCDCVPVLEESRSVLEPDAPLPDEVPEELVPDVAEEPDEL